jgi:hypothetical protein
VTCIPNNSVVSSTLPQSVHTISPEFSKLLLPQKRREVAPQATVDMRKTTSTSWSEKASIIVVLMEYTVSLSTTKLQASLHS